MAKELIYISNDVTQGRYNQWLKRLETQLNKPTNQDSIKVIKVVKPTNKKNHKTVGTSVTNSQYPLPLWLKLSWPLGI